MYNRYTPQSDGSYRRDKIPEPTPPPPRRPRPAPPPPPCDDPPIAPPCDPAPPCDVPPPPHCPAPHPPGQKEGIMGFLRQLLPKDFDTEDLLIILLLLLMAGDCEEDRSNALLTLALYLFM